METRIKGQEVAIRLSVGGDVQNTITAIRDFNVQLDVELTDEGYLGETTNRKDEIFNGISGAFTVDPESQDLILLSDFVKRRAQRRADAPLSRTINATVRFNFPNGDAPLVLVPDMKFGPMNIQVPDRGSYVSEPFSYATSDWKVIST